MVTSLKISSPSLDFITYSPSQLGPSALKSGKIHFKNKPPTSKLQALTLQSYYQATLC